MRATGQNAEPLNRKPSAQERGGLPGHVRWLERWTDLFSRQQGRALVIDGGWGLESSLLLGLGFYVTAVDFSAEPNEESLQRNPLAEHHNVNIRNLGEPLTGRFSIIAANLSLQAFERRQIEQVFKTAVGFLSPLGVFALRVDASILAPSEKLRPLVKPAETSMNHKWITALVERELEHVSVERWNSSRGGGQESVLEIVGAKSGGGAPDAWPVPIAANRRRPVEPVRGR